MRGKADWFTAFGRAHAADQAEGFHGRLVLTSVSDVNRELYGKYGEMVRGTQKRVASPVILRESSYGTAQTDQLSCDRNRYSWLPICRESQCRPR